MLAYMSPQPANSSPGTSAPRAACCCLSTDGALQGSTTGMAATACQTRSRDCHTTTRILACRAGHPRPSSKQLGSSKGTSCALSLLLSHFLSSWASAVALSWLGLGFLPLCSLHTANWSRRTWHRRPPTSSPPPPNGHGPDDDGDDNNNNTDGIHAAHGPWPRQPRRNAEPAWVQTSANLAKQRTQSFEECTLWAMIYTALQTRTAACSHSGSLSLPAPMASIPSLEIAAWTRMPKKAGQLTMMLSLSWDVVAG
jgi:hypothetical protein